MRLRLAMTAIAVLAVSGVVVHAHQRASAEQVRVALLEADEVAPPALAPPAPGGAGEAPVGAAPVAVPPGAPVGGAPPVTATPPVAAVPPVIAVPAAPGAAPAVGAAVPAPAGAPPAFRFGVVGTGQNVPVQVTPPNPFYPPGQAFYPVPQPGNDPETNELTSQDQQLEQEVQSLTRQLADSDDDKQRAELKDKLAAALEKQFDAQQKLRQLEISRIEARVQKLRDLVRKRTESRRKIIDNRFEQLLNDAEGLGWNSTKGGGIQFVPPGNPGTKPRAELPHTLAPATSKAS